MYVYYYYYYYLFVYLLIENSCNSRTSLVFVFHALADCFKPYSDLVTSLIYTPDFPFRSHHNHQVGIYTYKFSLMSSLRKDVLTL